MCDRLRVIRIPAYQRALQLAKERKDAIWLDVGCCCMFHSFVEPHDFEQDLAF